MQFKKFTYLILIVLLAIVTACSSQKKLMRNAEQSYENGEYVNALKYYEQLLETAESKQSQANFSYYIAECYRNLNDTRKAEKFYKKAVKYRSRQKTANLWLGYAYLSNEKYADAESAFKAYKKQMPKDKRADNAIESCSLAVAWTQNPTRYEVENIRAINSKQSDFSPAYSTNDFSTVYFTSSRILDDEKPKINSVSGMKYTDIYEIRNDRKGKWSDPVKIEDTTVNGLWDEGTPNFSLEKTDLYYTQCKQETGKNLGCQIMKTSLRGGSWGTMTRIDIVGDSISIGHPSISADGLVLYFAARLENGFGGADIWKVERENDSDEWSRPINMGDVINTPGDELYPFIREDGTLFFSSDYHPGMGGLDIFRAIKDEYGDWEIANMKFPLNSSQDDFGIVFQGAKEKGLFSSNRKKGRGEDDIYSFELPELQISVEGKVKDVSTGKYMSETDVTLIGSDGSVQTTQTKFDGSYNFKLEQYTDYLVVSSIKGFLTQKTAITTNNISDNKVFDVNFELITMSKPVEIPNIFYESGKWTLNESSKEALEKLGKLLQDNPNVTIELGAHTDMIGDSKGNLNLSKKRAQSVVTYLNEKGYDPDRLIAKGYGEDMPVVVTDEIAKLDTSFTVGQILSQEFIKTLPKASQEIANQVNRRTELRILSTNYIPKPEYFIRNKKKYSTSR